MKRTVQLEQRKKGKKTARTGWQEKKVKQTGREGKATKMQTVPGEWLYLAPQGVDAGRIAEALAGTYETELWEDAGVVEVVFGEKQSVDIEHTKVHPKERLQGSLSCHICRGELWMCGAGHEVDSGAVRRAFLWGHGGFFTCCAAIGTADVRRRRTADKASGGMSWRLGCGGSSQWMGNAKMIG